MEGDANWVERRWYFGVSTTTYVGTPQGVQSCLRRPGLHAGDIHVLDNGGGLGVSGLVEVASPTKGLSEYYDEGSGVFIGVGVPSDNAESW